MAVFVTRLTEPSKCSVYMKHAIAAVQSEQSGKYADAYLRWEMAEKQAKSEIKRVWADDRRAFCNRAMIHGWGKQSESE